MEYSKANSIRRRLRDEVRDNKLLNCLTAESIGMLPEAFERDVNRKLDRLQAHLHTLKK